MRFVTVRIVFRVIMIAVITNDFWSQGFPLLSIIRVEGVRKRLFTHFLAINLESVETSSAGCVGIVY